MATTSPFSAGTRSSRFSSFSNMSTLSLGSASATDAPAARRIIRRNKGMAEAEQEEERNLVGDDVVALVEPRPSFGVACGSIAEILEGRI